MSASKLRAFKIFRDFFAHYAWIGLLFILVAIIVKLDESPKSVYILIFTELVLTIGIAILVSAIFSFAADSSSFMDRVRTLLGDVVISKEFLRNIDAEGKRNALKILVSATQTERRLYSNIESYYDYQIEKALNISRNAIRSHYNLTARASYNSEKDIISIDHHITYRLFPSATGYENIKLRFDDISEEIKPTCKYVIISSPTGKRKEYKTPKLEPNLHSGLKTLFTEVNLASDFPPETSHLDIEISVQELGKGKWFPISFQALLPTDGFNFRLTCDSPLKIRHIEPYWSGNGLNINDHTESDISASCNQWMNEGCGISVIVEIK